MAQSISPFCMRKPFEAPLILKARRGNFITARLLWVYNEFVLSFFFVLFPKENFMQVVCVQEFIKESE